MSRIDISMWDDKPDDGLAETAKEAFKEFRNKLNKVQKKKSMKLASWAKAQCHHDEWELFKRARRKNTELRCPVGNIRGEIRRVTREQLQNARYRNVISIYPSSIYSAPRSDMR